MAIVFISPKQRQRTFFTGITILFVLLLLIISLGVFLSKPKPVPAELVFNRPKIDINLQILDSEQVKILEPAVQMNLQFRYTATTEKGVKISGVITAVSQEKAQKILQGIKLSAINIEEAKIGRGNPFAPYYQPATAENTEVQPYKTNSNKIVSSPAVESSNVTTEIIDQPTIDQSTIDQSTIDQSTIDQSAIDQSAIDQSAIDQSAIDQSAIDQSTP